MHNCLNVHKIIVSIVLVFSFSNVWAAGWSGLTKVLEVMPDSNGILYVKFAEMNNPAGCTYDDLMVVDPANPSFKLIYSSLMAAQAANLSLYYYYSSTCIASRAVITTVKTVSP